MNGEYAGFFDIGMVQRNEKNAIIAHGTMCLIRRSALRRRRQLVERHDLRGHRSRADHPRARLHRALHQPPLRLRPAARQLSRLQAPARPLGLWRLPDHEEALAPLPAGPQPAHPRAEARIRARLAVLARRRKRRRAGRAAQSDLGAVRRHRRHRHPRQDSDHPDPGRLRGGGRCISSRSTGCASAFPAARCSARCSPPWRCNGPSRARSASA